MNNYGTEDYVEKPEHDFKHTDERTDERIDERTDERIEADEGDADYTGNAGDAAVTEPAGHEAAFAEPDEHEALTTESAEPEPWIAETDEQETPVAEPGEHETAASEPLLAPTSAEAFLDRWSDVQTTFIEDPHRSVTEADALLTEVLSAYRDAVEQRREQISSAWSGDAADTEKMRLALLDYRNVITVMLPAHSDGGKTGAVA